MVYKFNTEPWVCCHGINNAHGFVAQTEYGVFVIALIGAIIAGMSVYYASRIQKP